MKFGLGKQQLKENGLILVKHGRLDPKLLNKVCFHFDFLGGWHPVVELLLELDLEGLMDESTEGTHHFFDHLLVRLDFIVVNFLLEAIVQLHAFWDLDLD